MPAFTQKLRPILLSTLSMVVGYLSISITTALLYGIWLSDANHGLTPQFLAFAAVCGLGFSALSGYLVALVAQRAPIAHAAIFSGVLTLIWLVSFIGGAREPLFIALLNIAIAITGVMAGGLMRLLQVNASVQSEEVPAEAVPLES